MKHAQSENQEPVGEVLNERGEIDYISYVPPVGTSVYTAPFAAQRPWQGLTEGERNDLEDYFKMTIGKVAFDAIEARLKERNT
jgi:hypothetical protein